MSAGSKGICVIIPAFENAGTIVSVIKGALSYVPDVFVVDDGSTDETASLLRDLSSQEPRLRVVTHSRNRGKGRAIKDGFLAAKAEGFSVAITMDADGQHFPEDIPKFLSVNSMRPDAMIMGSRNISADGMPARNTFANRFSNFWFRFQTGVDLPDTQSGFRLYQLETLGKMPLLTSRYEAELELLVFQCWKGVPILSVPVGVWYPPEGERVTHFRPFLDFARISVLNCVLCVLAIVYGLPARFLRYQARLNRRQIK